MCVFVCGTFQDTFYWHSENLFLAYEGPHERVFHQYLFPQPQVSFSPSRLCFPDVDECSLQTHTCWNHSVCVNLPGGYDCVCVSGPGCSGDCQQDKGIRRNGEDWKPSFDRCALCSCKVGPACMHSLLQCRYYTVIDWYLWQLWVNPGCHVSGWKALLSVCRFLLSCWREQKNLSGDL